MGNCSHSQDSSLLEHPARQSLSQLHVARLLMPKESPQKDNKDFNHSTDICIKDLGVNQPVTDTSKCNAAKTYVLRSLCHTCLWAGRPLKRVFFHWLQQSFRLLPDAEWGVPYLCEPGVAFCTAELKKASLKKSREPLKTTLALFLAWRPAISSVFFPTACGYWNGKNVNLQSDRSQLFPTWFLY